MLSDFLNNLQQAKFLEKKTARAENHVRLGLSDLSVSESKSREVKVYVGDELLASLLVGNSASHSNGSYFRFTGEDQVWLMDKQLEAEAEPADWLDPVIIDIAEENVTKVVQSNTSGELISVTREDQEDDLSNFVPQSIPPGKKLIYPTAANKLARALVNMNLEDVLPVGDMDWSDANKTEFSLKSGLQFAVLSKAVDGKHWLRFNFAADQEKDSADATSKLLTSLGPWAFAVSEITFKDFSTSSEDLFDDLESESAEE
jgi:hypothetical protein